MNMAEAGTYISMAFAVAMYAFIFLLVVLAAKELLPEYSGDSLLHIIMVVLATMLGGVVAGMVCSFVGGRRERKKQDFDKSALAKNNIKSA